MIWCWNGAYGIRRAAGASLLGIALLALAGCDRLAGDPPGLLRADAPQVLKVGQAVYAARCAACHGAQMEGQPNWRERDASGRLPAPPHDASGHTWHHPDDLLFRITKYGTAKAANLKDFESGMPPFEGVLTDAEIVAALSWIKSRWPAEIRQQQEALTASQAAQKRP